MRMRSGNLTTWTLVALLLVMAMPGHVRAIVDVANKLNSIIIPKVDVHEFDVASMLEFLSIKSKQLDPERIGVPLRLELPHGPEGKPPRIHREISITLDNVTLGMLLDSICAQTNLLYKIENGVAVFRPAGPGNEERDKLVIARLNSTIIEKVNFDRLDIARAIEFLIEKSKELDRGHKCIAFRLELLVGADAQAHHIHREVSFTFDHVPMNELLAYISEQTNLSYKIENGVVVLRPSVSR